MARGGKGKERKIHSHVLDVLVFAQCRLLLLGEGFVPHCAQVSPQPRHQEEREEGEGHQVQQRRLGSLEHLS